MAECSVTTALNKMVLVGEVMTKNPICVHSDDSITKARSLMRRHGFRALPVVDKTLVGIISRNDVLKVTSSKTNIKINGLMSTNIIGVKPSDDLLIAARLIVSSGVRQLPVVDKDLSGILSSLDVLSGFVKENPAPAIKIIGDVMDKNVVYCEPDDDLSKVWENMSTMDCSGLPVVRKNEIIGMITMNDILKHGKARLSKESGKARSINVARVMSTPAITCEVDTPTKEVAGIMVKRRILRIPIIEENKPIGIVDVKDVLRAYMGK